MNEIPDWMKIDWALWVAVALMACSVGAVLGSVAFVVWWAFR